MFNPLIVHMTLSTGPLLPHFKKEGREGRYNKISTKASDCIELCLVTCYMYLESEKAESMTMGKLQNRLP